jgi:hypothetical protein
MDRELLRRIPDDELLRRLADLLRESRRNEADLVAHIGEVDERRLYARQAAPSMFVYCTDVLHLSEAEAYLRITAARASRERPVLMEMLRDGRLHLSGIAKLVPHLTEENAATLLRRATHRSKRQILELVAEVAPRPDLPAVMRRLPERHTVEVTGAGVAAPGVAAPGVAAAGVAAAGVARVGVPGVLVSAGGVTAVAAPQHELRPDRVDLRLAVPAPTGEMEPLAPGRYKVQFTASTQLHDKLERLQALMRGRGPDADLATIIEEAVTETLERLEAKRFALTKAPRKALRETNMAPVSRHIPAAVRRAVHARDGGGCGYVDERGRRCPERVRLEFHHRYPFGRGGDHSPKNIGLLCRAHNLLVAQVDFGRGTMAWCRGSKQPRSQERGHERR